MDDKNLPEVTEALLTELERLPDPRVLALTREVRRLRALDGHGLARLQIAGHGRDRYPSAVLQALKACAETGELADEILKHAADPSPARLERVREEYADAGLALFALGDKLGLGLLVSMAALVQGDDRTFGARPAAGVLPPGPAPARQRLLEERGAALHAAAETWDHRAVPRPGAEAESRTGAWLEAYLSSCAGIPLTQDSFLPAADREDRNRSCPDGGTCHHLCPVAGPCFRVLACGPLSGAFPGDEWPQEVRDRETERGEVPGGQGGEALPS